MTDLVIEGLAVDLANLEQELVEALQDAVTYRACYLASLELLEASERERVALRGRLRQYMGIDDRTSPRAHAESE